MLKFSRFDQTKQKALYVQKKREIRDSMERDAVLYHYHLPHCFAIIPANK